MKRLMLYAVLTLLLIPGGDVGARTASDWWDDKAGRYGLSIDTSAIPDYYGFTATRDWGRVFWQQQYAPADVAMLVVLKMDMRQQVGACAAGTYTWTIANVDALFACEQPLIQTAVVRWPGMVYAVANEPNFGPPATPSVYAYAVGLYGDYIKSLDPTARIMTGGILLDEGWACSFAFCDDGYCDCWEWSAALVQLAADDIDVYGINPYAFYRLENGEAAGHTIGEITHFHDIVQQLDPGTPLWILEYGYYKEWPVELIADYMDEVNGWLDVNHSRYNIDRWFWFHGAHTCNADYDPCNSGMFDLPLTRNSATPLGDTYQTRFRVFVDSPSYQRDVTRVRGSMTNPFASLAEAQQWGSAGAGIYDFRTGAVVGTVPGSRVYLPVCPDIGEFWN